MIVGEHGDPELVLWSQASIGPAPILDWTPEVGRSPPTAEGLASVAEEVKTAAYRVIGGKGATNYAIGLSGARIVEAILRDEGVILPVSSVLDDYLGISGVALSVPSVVDARGVSRVIEVPYSQPEMALLEHSAHTLEESLRSLQF